MKRDRSGMTLIELITTLAIVAFFMTALSFTVVSLSNIWMNFTDDDFFEHHVEGVMLFLNKSLEAAEGVPGGSESEGPQLPVEWGRPPGWGDLDDPLLYFRQKEAPALFVREGQSLPDINAYLYFDQRDGLSVLWYSNLDGEEIEDTRDLKNSLISPYLEELEYAYYDEEQDDWDIYDDPEEGDDDAFILPQYLKLRFVYDDEDDRQELTRSLFIPQRSTGVPLF